MKGGCHREREPFLMRCEAQRGVGVAVFGGRWRAVEEKVREEVWIWKALNTKLRNVYFILLA